MTKPREGGYFGSMRFLCFAIPLALSPLSLQAQVLAGDTTGLLYTQVEALIASPFGPGFNGDEATLSLTGTMDLFLFAGNIHVGTNDGAWTQVNPTPSGLEVAADQPGGSMAERFDSLTPVNASLAWIGHSELMGDQLFLASLMRDISEPTNWIGSGQWFQGEGDTTHGFLAVRFPQPIDTLYGWIRLTSYVTRDSSWLHIHDYAMETSAVNSTNEQVSSPPLMAFFDPNGTLQIRGGEIGRSMQITVSDLAGRVLVSPTVVYPAAIDIPSSSQGLYVITVAQGAALRTFKLIR